MKEQIDLLNEKLKELAKKEEKKILTVVISKKSKKTFDGVC